MKIETKMRVERATAVLSPFEVLQAIADFVDKYQPDFRGWMVVRNGIEIDEAGGAAAPLERCGEPDPALAAEARAKGESE